MEPYVRAGENIKITLVGHVSDRPRYPDEQDANEKGLSLLRAQYARAGHPHLNWGVMDSKKITLKSNGAVVASLENNEKNRALAALICRAVGLGWCMLNELEPEVA